MVSENLSRSLISRREAIRRVSLLLGGYALVGGNALLSGCAAVDIRRAGALFSAADIALLDEIADTILPATDTPGAKAAGVGPFIAVMVTDAYREREQRVFRDGLEAIEAASRAQHATSFMNARPAQRLALVERLDREQYQAMRVRAAGAPPHYFRMLKELTLLGYFTSEIGCTQALRYMETPGRFEPCVPYVPGERAWASHA